MVFVANLALSQDGPREASAVFVRRRSLAGIVFAWSSVMAVLCAGGDTFCNFLRFRELRAARGVHSARRVRMQPSTICSAALPKTSLRWAPLDPPSDRGDGSGEVVARILEAGVRLLLRKYRNVDVVVQSSLAELVRGRVDAVHLSGNDWRSRRDLTARRLVVAALGGARLDYMQVLAGKIQLTRPAEGWAEATFDATDFGNFLVYGPVAAFAPVIEGRRFIFTKDGVSIDAASRRVVFHGRYGGRRLRMALETQTDAGDEVSVRIVEAWPPTDGTDALHGAQIKEVENSLARFFNTLSVDLAGILLRFAALGFPTGSSDSSSSPVSLRLRATIRRIPNPLTDRI